MRSVAKRSSQRFSGEMCWGHPVLQTPSPPFQKPLQMFMRYRCTRFVSSTFSQRALVFWISGGVMQCDRR